MKSKQDKIRQRRTYQDWEKLLRFLNRNPSKKTIMKKIHTIIDDRRGFHSQTNSDKSMESLRTLIKDKNL